MKWTKGISVLAAVAVLVLACGQGDAQTPAGTDAALRAGVMAVQAESYRLVQVGGEPLPVVTEEEDGCREQVTGANLALEDDGTWTLQVAEREVCDGTPEESTEEETGTYTVEGQTIHFAEASDDEDAAESEDEAENDENETEEDDENEAEDDDEAEQAERDVDELDVGTLSGDGLRVQLADGQTTLLFQQ